MVVNQNAEAEDTVQSVLGDSLSLETDTCPVEGQNSSVNFHKEATDSGLESIVKHLNVN